MDKKKIFSWKGLHWDTRYSPTKRDLEAIALCPRKGCHCELDKTKEHNTYQCIDCNFGISLDKPLYAKATDFLKVLRSDRYKDAEVINIDNELVRIKRGGEDDGDYWIDAKISKNKKDELQLMVLVGSKKEKDKVQLFLDPKNERLAFDQNNSHPRRIFAKVIGIFKNSKSEISLRKE